MIYFSKTTKGFYDPEINTNLPQDAVQISNELYQTILRGIEKGQIVNADNNGFPILTGEIVIVNGASYGSI